MNIKCFKSFAKNEIGNDYVVGDIHGCFTLLQRKLDELKFNPETDRLFSVGDLVDRGNESHLAVEWINKDWFHCVMGNHEEMAVEWYDYANLIQKDGWNTDYLENYMHIGGKWFIDLTEIEQEKIYLAFESLPLAIEVETSNGLVGITHAATHYNDWNELKEKLHNTDKLTNEEWLDIIDGLTWERNLLRLGDSRVIDNVNILYHGHTPVSKIVALGNRVYIDTGAVYTGQLTILKL